MVVMAAVVLAVVMAGVTMSAVIMAAAITAAVIMAAVIMAAGCRCSGSGQGGGGFSHSVVGAQICLTMYAKIFFQFFLVTILSEIRARCQLPHTGL